MKKLLWTLVGILVMIVFYFVVADTPLDPLAWDPPPKPEMTGPLAPNDALKNATVIAAGQVQGPEDVAVAADGSLFTGCADGTVRKIDPDGKVSIFARTDGRPLGLQFDASGNLIVCDAYMGLLKITPEGIVTVLCTEADGVPFKIPDDLDIASDGKIYFSDASSRYKVDQMLYDLFDHRPNGRLLCYDPATHKAKVLLDKLYFANGVALSPDESFVLVNETYAYRITRLWLKGPKAGQRDIFAENLPGFPDNLSRGSKNYWLAMYTVRNDSADMMHPYPWLKKQVSKLPHFLWPKPEPYGLVLALDDDGKIIKSYQDPTGKHLTTITSVNEYKGCLYLGSLINDRIGKFCP